MYSCAIHRLEINDNEKGSHSVVEKLIGSFISIGAE